MKKIKSLPEMNVAESSMFRFMELCVKANPGLVRTREFVEMVEANKFMMDKMPLPLAPMSADLSAYNVELDRKIERLTAIQMGANKDSDRIKRAIIDYINKL